MTELKELLTGGISGQAFLAAEILAFVGMILRSLVGVLKRKPVSRRPKPETFHFGFWIVDNGRRWLIVIITTYLLLRFGAWIIPAAGLDPSILDSNPSLLLAFGIGLLNDWVVRKFQNYIKEKTTEK